MDLGQNIATLRKKLGFKREELGGAVGTSGAVIGRYERGEITPSVEMAKKIAQHLQVSLDFLVGSTDKEVDKKTLSRINQIQNLSKKEKELVFEFLDAFLTKAKLKQALE